jgi:asparagine synthase (glutamine-hydrolysing)
MCGIAGFISCKRQEWDLFSTIQKMTDSMEHRGPDDNGYCLLSFDEINYNIAFGHRRLSIIDLSPLGHQPMWSKDKDLCIILNGEIYNYIELREELIGKGYSFISTSDTEVIIYAYAEWGIECFKKFNGMWAIALWDKKRRKIILSRDRFGKKPLYYYHTKDEFVFASEIKAILRYPGYQKAPNYEKIFRYLSTNYRYVDVDYSSYFECINSIPKSSVIELDENLNMKEHSYWNLESNIISNNISEKRAIEEFRDLFTDAVKIRLRSDVPVGCFLSGGMDSTSITCVAYHILKQPIITFSGITGEEKGVYDESEYIHSVIRHTDAKYHFIRPEPIDIFDVVNEMLQFHDEPICTITWYNLYLIAKKIKNEKIIVILNGHSGDELLAGYWDYYQYNFFDLEQSGEYDLLEKEIKHWQENHHRDMNEIDRYKRYIDQLLKGETNEMERFPNYSDCFIDEIANKFKRIVRFEVPKWKSLLSKRMYSDLMFEGVPPVLRVEDRNTMANSIESRSPFLDYRLAEFCFSLPNKFKIRNGLGKWILREAMKGILPEDVRTRKDKAGFIAPADEWFRTVNKKQVYDLINSVSLKRRNLFNIDRINLVFEEHLNSEKNHYMFIWQLINTELWFKRFFD